MALSNKDKKENFKDAFIITSTKRFRVRACGIVIKNDKVLMVKNNVDDYYYSLGGAVHIGETIENACLREVLEETGYHYEIDRLVFVHENFFNQDGLLWHELAFYYLMKENKNEVFTISYGTFGAKEEKVWIPIEKFSEYKAFPKFFDQELKSLPNNVKVITSFE